VTARKAVAVSARHRLPVQGDGELLGNTPLQVQVVAQALRVIVPATSSGPQDVSGA